MVEKDLATHLKESPRWRVSNDLKNSELDTVQIGIFNVYCVHSPSQPQGRTNVWAIQFGRSGVIGDYYYRLLVQKENFGDNLSLRLECRSSMPSEKVLKAHDIGLTRRDGAIQQTSLGRLLSVIREEGLENFKFINGRGQRFWIYMFLVKLHGRGLIWHRDRINDARLVMAKLYPTVAGAAVIDYPIENGRLY